MSYGRIGGPGEPSTCPNCGEEGQPFRDGLALCENEDCPVEIYRPEDGQRRGSGRHRPVRRRSGGPGDEQGSGPGPGSE